MTKVLAKIPKPKAKAPPHVRTPMPAQRQMLLQPALQVGAVNDPAEHEAETMAARVVAASAPALPVANPTSDTSAAPSVRRSAAEQPNLDQLDTGSLPADHADVEVPKSEDVSTEGLEGKDTSELDSGTPQDTSGEPAAPDAPPILDAPIALAAPLRRADTGAVVGRMGGAAPKDVAAMVANPGPGRVLPRSVRQKIEPHFGTSFANVRLHDTASDRMAAQRIGARAFTHKNHIWLGKGESESNTRLMAHELTHVVQQTQGSEQLPLSRSTVPAVTRAPAKPVLRRGYFADKAESVARHVPGYSLITVLVGRKLISGKKVAMTGENLLGGFMGLIPGGTLIFDRLKEARVISEAFEWVKGKLGELNLTWARIKSDLSDALDTLNPLKAARNVKNMVKGLVRDIVRFVGAIAKKLLEFIVRGALKLAGSFGEKVWGILQRAGTVISLILEDPLGFAKNLVKAVIGGFKQFGANIWEHLKSGLLGWLFGSLSSAGIEMPAKLDFKGLISIALQVLGLTYANFRKQLVKKLGPKGEKMVSMMETSVAVVKTLLKEGFAGIWQKMLEMIDEFRGTVIGGISEMIVTTMINAGIGWLAGLSNPVGAIIKVVLSIYNLIVAFIERFQQIVDVCESIFNSMASIAKGQVTQAANFIEQTIGRTVPLIISFLAALIPVSGITSKIKKVIKNLQAPVQKAMGKLIGFLVKKAKKLFSKLIGKVNGKRKYPSVNFKIGKKQHRIFAEKSGKKIVVKIASSTGKDIAKMAAFHAEQSKVINKTDGAGADASKALTKTLQAETKEADGDTEKAAKKVKPDSKNQNQRKPIDTLQKELGDTGKDLEQSGKTIDTLSQISSQTEAGMFRAAEPRLLQLEGKQGPHGKLLKEVKSKNYSDLVGYSVTSYYEMDHTMEKRFAKVILENLPQIDPSTAAENDKDTVTSKARADRAAQFDAAKGNRAGKTGKKTAVALDDAAPLGEIGKSITKIRDTAPEFPAVAVYRHNHVTDKGLKSHQSVIDKARAEAKAGNDPHAHVKSSLKAQMDLEEKDMLAKLDADQVAKDNPTLKSNMKAGIQEARVANDVLFGLGDIQKREVADEEKKDRDNNDQSSILSFEGGKGAPDFLNKEGVGGPYNSLKGTTKHLERDHIVDKAYPKNAAKADMLTDAEKGAFEALVRASLKAQNKKMSKNRSARMAEVIAAKVFPASSEMAQYTDGKGYAIPIYKPVADKITSATGSALSADKFAAKVAGLDQSGLAAYVIDGTTAKRDAARSARAQKLGALVAERTGTHSAHAKAAYSENMRITVAQQPDAAKQAAQAHMTKIIGQVNASLTAARQQTQSLF